MTAVGDSFSLREGETLTVTSVRPELLELEAEWQAGESKPPAHLHPAQEEHFEVHEGELNVDLDGKRRVLAAGDAIDIPRGTPHSMWPGSEGARATWQVRPALRTAEFFAAVDASWRHKSKNGQMTLLGAGPVLREFDDVFRLPLPTLVQRPLLAGLSALGRLRGYSRPG